MGIIEEGYTIVKAENYNYGDNMTAPVWFDEKIGDVTIKVPHKLVMFVESKTNPEERFVIMFTPFDEYEVDIHWEKKHIEDGFGDQIPLCIAGGVQGVFEYELILPALL